MQNVAFDIKQEEINKPNPMTFQPEQKVQISEIPTDVMLIIFSFLEVKDLCRNAISVCRPWKKMIDNDNLWRLLYDKEFFHSNLYSKVKAKEETWKQTYQFFMQKSHIISFPDGTIAEGQFKNGKLYKGKMTQSNGTIVETKEEGKFKDAVLYGKGRISFPDGKTLQGEFKNHRLNGRGFITQTDGTTLKGRFQNDQLEGFGMMLKPDGTKVRGIFNQNELTGPKNRSWKKGEKKIKGQQPEHRSRRVNNLRTLFLSQQK